MSDHPHQIIVAPLGAKREALGLACAIGVICLLVGLRGFFLASNTTPLLLQSHHRLDSTLNAKERLLYQSLLAAQGEIIYLWQENGAWPSAELLAQEFIPPFAEEFLPAHVHGYTWKTYDRGPWVDYIAERPQGQDDDPSLLLRVINLHADFHPHPHPGKDYDPNQQAACQIWFHPQNLQRYAGMQLAERGWSWIIAPDDPILSMESPKVKPAQGGYHEP